MEGTLAEKHLSLAVLAMWGVGVLAILARLLSLEYLLCHQSIILGSTT